MLYHPFLLHPLHYRVYWKVDVWDQWGSKCNSSPSYSWFESGLLGEDNKNNDVDWKGYWIEREDNPHYNYKNECRYYEDHPVPLFRKSFQLQYKSEFVQRVFSIHHMLLSLIYLTPLLL